MVSVTDTLSFPIVRKAGRYYRPELDVLRLIAFLLVFLHHVFFRYPLEKQVVHTIAADVESNIANACAFGLCLFYFLSSYLITTLLLIELNETDGINVKEFYLRRVLRIWPLYIVGLSIGMVYALVYAAPEQFEMLCYYVAFLGNWFYQNHDWGSNLMTPLWSISVEEQFYLVLPLFVLALGTTRLIWGGFGVVILSIAALYYQGEQHLSVDTAIWTNTLSHAIFVGSGIIVAVITYERLPKMNIRARLVAAAVAFILLFLSASVFKARAVEYASSGSAIAFGYMLVAVACALLLISLLNSDVTFPAPIVYLGKISFGLYVYHILAMRIAERVFSPGASVPIPSAIADFCSLPLLVLYAALSYRYIEAPFLRLKTKFTYVASRPD